MLYTIQNAWYSFCLFCEYWFEIINYDMHYKHMCYKCLACESKMASILNLIVGILVSSGLPTELTTELPTELPPISVYWSSGQPYLYGKIPIGSPLRCPLSCPLSPYVEVVGSLICMAKFPWAAHSIPRKLPTFFIFGRSGLPTELRTVSIYGSSGEPNLHGNISMGRPLRYPRAAHGQRSGQLPCFFRMGRRVKGTENLMLSLSKRVKRLRRRQYRKVFIDKTKGLVFGSSTTLHRPFLKHCTLNYSKVVKTTWRALSNLIPDLHDC